MRLIKIKEVMYMTGLARATIYKFIDLDKFPKQVSLGGRAVAWVEAEIEEWVLEKVEARDAEDL
ncbi:AlpA family transcriptional regulator [Motilimonas sp. 1_MG-2023]|uniref:AlpA family transcriptional regulator n=1 Tax=Motilimonas sp. 1_MG-2023 TaxID=3062672 RepID=UPI0026E3C512|nr:AlpA family transcriptional regulator [Motilimonas sp. 1_MG-2023]MDO6528229.1 AlpA family transcriptional regulator [Motilimonas sp. 1_MG-2023]